MFCFAQYNIVRSLAPNNNAASRKYKIVQPFEVYCGQLVDDDRCLQHPLLVDELHDTGIIQTECLIKRLLLDNYEVMHTQRLKHVGEDVAEALKNWEAQEGGKV